MSNVQQAVEIVVIADRSGSMNTIRDDAIGGFNNFLTEQKQLPGAANLTLILFDDQYEVPVNGVAVQHVAELTRETFVPRGMTAMNDAIGRTLVELETKAPEKAIICILTDGAENASREYTSRQIKDKIKAAEARGWEVIFLAANIDAFATGGSLGIATANTMNFDASAEGVHNAYASMSLRASSYRSA
jgi:ADP-heptose:LPS heptosyltransferase